MHLILTIIIICGVQLHMEAQTIETIACGQSRPAVLNSTGRFTSPGYPNKYPDNSMCEWRITSQSPNGTLMLDFVSIQTEGMNADDIAVYDGSSASSPELVRYSGNYTNTVIPTVYSTGRYLYVVFYSDPSSNDVGFVAKSTDDTACRAPRELDAASGWFSSPYFPESYTPNKTCGWTLKIGLNERAVLWFNAFDIGVLDADCSLGYLEVRLSNETIRLCGTSKRNITMESTTSFTFVSPANEGQGFIAFYQKEVRLSTVPSAAAAATTTTTLQPVSATVHPTKSPETSVAQTLFPSRSPQTTHTTSVARTVFPSRTVVTTTAKSCGSSFHYHNILMFLVPLISNSLTVTIL